MIRWIVIAKNGSALCPFVFAAAAERNPYQQIGVRRKSDLGRYLSQLRFRGDTTPLGCGRRATRIASGEEHRQFVRGERFCGLVDR